MHVNYSQLLFLRHTFFNKTDKKGGEMSEPLEFPYVAAIPQKIISDKNLSAGAKLHFACVLSWADMQGRLEYTIKQMAATYLKPETIIECWNIELENAGFLQVHENYLEVIA